MYTDGACSNNPGIGGWAFAFFDEKEAKYFSGNNVYTTNNRMELTAVLKGIRYVLKNIDELLDSLKVVNDEVVELEVISDSAYVVNAIKSNWIQSWKNNGWKTKDGSDVKNQDLWFVLSKYMNLLSVKGITLIVTKVKGHSGNTMNEKVDELAKEEIEKLKGEFENEDSEIYL